MMKDSRIETMAVFACRYAHDRPTSAAHAVVVEVIANKERIGQSTREQIIKEAYNEATCNFGDWERLIKGLRDG